MAIASSGAAPVSERVAVLGTGTMAPGIAASFAAAGWPARLWGRDADRLNAASERATAALGQLRAEQLAGPSATTVSATHDLAAALADVSLVVEAVREDAATKRSLFEQVERHAAPGALLASTTSGLLIDDFVGPSPERYLALHFWNPAHLMPLVEVAGGQATPGEVVDRGCAIVQAIGKTPVRLRRPVVGFIGTRLQQAVVREAIALLEAGVADAADIDAATRLSFGARFPVMGPLETSDVGGLDVVLAIHDYLLGELDRSVEPNPLLRSLVDRGELGAKTGRGFYDWSVRSADELRAERDRELITRVRMLRDAEEGKQGR